MAHADLRPLERTVVKRSEQGMARAEVAWRLRRTPGSIQQILDLAKVPRSSSPASTTPGTLRPIERHILGARRDGTHTAEIAARLRRTPEFVDRVEGYAHYKLAQVAG
ncbi:MAG: hypothetical protein M5U31_03750 [Acidimicrobiia bacterium]|nr:hypothetical protein [Acidimicrobiia bacterium]